MGAGRTEREAEDPKGLKPRECDTRAGQGTERNAVARHARPHRNGVQG